VDGCNRSELPVTERRDRRRLRRSGPASDLYLALWNRAPLDSLHIEGDSSVVDMLRDNVRIRWG
jgi:hypothetical protein